MRLFSRRSPAVLVAIVAALAVAPPAMADTAPTTHSAAKGAAGWLARYLTDGERVELFFGGMAGEFPDMTADTVLALDAAGVGQDYAKKATAWLQTPLYLRGYLGDGVTQSSVSAHAHLALVAEAQGLNPADFGGVDLIGELKALMTPSGRFADKTATIDNSSGSSQALAIIALHRRGRAPKPAVDYLKSLQCPDGGFGTGNQDFCVSDLRVTSLAVQALVAVGRRGPIDRALDWLESVQNANGGFGGWMTSATAAGPPTVALHLGGRSEGVRRARAYIKSFQVPCTAPADQGGISDIGFGVFDGSHSVSAIGNIRATAAAVPALTGTSLATVTAHPSRPQAPTLACTP
jgi:hypothetical protein